MKRDDGPHLIMEFVDGGTLYELVNSMQEHSREVTLKQKLGIFNGISLALKYIHSHNIVHRDLSSANIFLTKDLEAKVGDFGMSQFCAISHNQPSTIAPGCPWYMPPECLTHDSHFSDKGDVFSFAVIMVELVIGKHPECNQKVGIMREVDRRQKDLSLFHHNAPKSLHGLVMQGLEDRPDDRPSAETISLELKQILDSFNEYSAEVQYMHTHRPQQASDMYIESPLVLLCDQGTQGSVLRPEEVSHDNEADAEGTQDSGTTNELRYVFIMAGFSMKETHNDYKSLLVTGVNHMHALSGASMPNETGESDLDEAYTPYESSCNSSLQCSSGPMSIIPPDTHTSNQNPSPSTETGPIENMKIPATCQLKSTSIDDSLALNVASGTMPFPFNKATKSKGKCSKMYHVIMCMKPSSSTLLQSIHCVGMSSRLQLPYIPRLSLYNIDPLGTSSTLSAIKNTSSTLLSFLNHFFSCATYALYVRYLCHTHVLNYALCYSEPPLKTQPKDLESTINTPVSLTKTLLPYSFIDKYTPYVFLLCLFNEKSNMLDIRWLHDLESVLCWSKSPALQCTEIVSTGKTIPAPHPSLSTYDHTFYTPLSLLNKMLAFVAYVRVFCLNNALKRALCSSESTHDGQLQCTTVASTVKCIVTLSGTMPLQFVYSHIPDREVLSLPNQQLPMDIRRLVCLFHAFKQTLCASEALDYEDAVLTNIHIQVYSSTPLLPSLPAYNHIPCALFLSLLHSTITSTSNISWLCLTHVMKNATDEKAEYIVFVHDHKKLLNFASSTPSYEAAVPTKVSKQMQLLPVTMNAVKYCEDTAKCYSLSCEIQNTTLKRALCSSESTHDGQLQCTTVASTVKCIVTLSGTMHLQFVYSHIPVLSLPDQLFPMDIRRLVCLFHAFKQTLCASEALDYEDAVLTIIPIQVYSSTPLLPSLPAYNHIPYALFLSLLHSTITSTSNISWLCLTHVMKNALCSTDEKTEYIVFAHDHKKLLNFASSTPSYEAAVPTKVSSPMQLLPVTMNAVKYCEDTAKCYPLSGEIQHTLNRPTTCIPLQPCRTDINSGYTTASQNMFTVQYASHPTHKHLQIVPVQQHTTLTSSVTIISSGRQHAFMYRVTIAGVKINTAGSEITISSFSLIELVGDNYTLLQREKLQIMIIRQLKHQYKCTNLAWSTGSSGAPSQPNYPTATLPSSRNAKCKTNNVPLFNKKKSTNVRQTHKNPLSYSYLTQGGNSAGGGGGSNPGDGGDISGAHESCTGTDSSPSPPSPPPTWFPESDQRPNPERPVKDLSSPQQKCVDRGGGASAAGNEGGNSAGGGGASIPGNGGGNNGGCESSAATESSNTKEKNANRGQTPNKPLSCSHPTHPIRSATHVPPHPPPPPPPHPPPPTPPWPLKSAHRPNPEGPVRDLSSPQQKCVDRGGGTCAAGNGGGNSAGGGGGSTPGNGGGNSGACESSAGTGSSSGSSTAGSTGSGGRREDDEEDDRNQRRRCEEIKAHSKEEKDEKNDDENKQDEESNPWHSDRKTGPQSNATDLNSDRVSVPEKLASVGPEKRQSDHVQRAKGSEGISGFPSPPQQHEGSINSPSMPCHEEPSQTVPDHVKKKRQPLEQMVQSQSAFLTSEVSDHTYTFHTSPSQTNHPNNSAHNPIEGDQHDFKSSVGNEGGIIFTTPCEEVGQSETSSSQAALVTGTGFSSIICPDTNIPMFPLTSTSHRLKCVAGGGGASAAGNGVGNSAGGGGASTPGNGGDNNGGHESSAGIKSSSGLEKNTNTGQFHNDPLSYSYPTHPNCSPTHSPHPPPHPHGPLSPYSSPSPPPPPPPPWPLKSAHRPNPEGPVRDLSSPQRKCVDRGGGASAAGNGGGNSAGGGGGSTPGNGGGNSGACESSAGTGSSSGSFTAGSTGSGGRREDDEEDDGNQRRRCEETKAHSKEEKDEKNDDENKQDEESNPWHSDRKTGPQSNATDLNSDRVSVPEKLASVGPEKRQSDHVQRAKGSEGISGFPSPPQQHEGSINSPSMPCHEEPSQTVPDHVKKKRQPLEQMVQSQSAFLTSEVSDHTYTFHTSPSQTNRPNNSAHNPIESDQHDFKSFMGNEGWISPVSMEDIFTTPCEEVGQSESSRSQAALVTRTGFSPICPDTNIPMSPLTLWKDSLSSIDSEYFDTVENPNQPSDNEDASEGQGSSDQSDDHRSEEGEEQEDNTTPLNETDNDKDPHTRDEDLEQTVECSDKGGDNNPPLTSHTSQPIPPVYHPPQPIYIFSEEDMKRDLEVVIPLGPPYTITPSCAEHRSLNTLVIIDDCNYCSPVEESPLVSMFENSILAAIQYYAMSLSLHSPDSIKNFARMASDQCILVKQVCVHVYIMTFLKRNQLTHVLCVVKVYIFLFSGCSTT